MFTVTLLTNPAGAPLDAALPEALRNAWGGRDVIWLAPDVAAEFEVETVPATVADVRADLSRMGVDLVVQPSAGRRKAMLIADMDSTMIEQECIDELADVAGVGEKVSEITARAMNGELDFDGALKERLSLLKGLDSAVIETVLSERITYTPGGRTLIATMKAHGAFALLVSGGFTAFTDRVAAHLGFDAHRANRLLIEDGRLTGAAAEPILGRDAKVAALEEFTAARGIGPADVIAVGDGANDLGMIERAGTGVALHAKPSVAAVAPHRIDHGDLTALLYIQGYSRDDFVTG